MSEAKTMMLGVIDVSSSMGHPIGNSHGDSKLQIGMSTLGFYMMQRMLAVKTAEFGLVTVGPGEDNLPCTSELVRMGRTSMDTINALYNDISPALSTARGSLVDGVLLGKEILIKEHANHKFNRMMVIITDGETEVEQGELDSLDSVLGEMAQSITVYVAMLGAVDESSSSVVKKENSKLLRTIALSTIGGKYMEINDVSQSFYLMKGPGLNTRPLQYKTVLELSPQLKIACTYWNKVSKTSLPSLKKRAVTAAAAAFGDGGGSGSVSGGDAKRDTTYRNPEDPDVELAITERTKGYRYGGQYVPMGIVEDSIFTVLGTAVVQVLGSVPAYSVPRHHLLSAPIVVQCNRDLYNGDYEQEAAATTMAAVVQALRNTGLVLLARFVKKDNADPMLAVLLPSPFSSSSPSSCVGGDGGAMKKEEAGENCCEDGGDGDEGVGLDSYKRTGSAAASEGAHVDTLLLYQIPFAEDIREFAFPSLTAFDPAIAANTSSSSATTGSSGVGKVQAQQRVMSSFVDSYLINRSSVDAISAVTPAAAAGTITSSTGARLPVTFNHLITPHNAAIQNFMGSVLTKGISAATTNTGSEDTKRVVALPGVGDVLLSPFSTEPSLAVQQSESGAKRKAKDAFSELCSEFELKPVDLPPDEADAEEGEGEGSGTEGRNRNSRSARYKSWRRKRQAFWSDIQITDEASQSLAAAAVGGNASLLAAAAAGNDDATAFAQSEDQFHSQSQSMAAAAVVPLPEFTVGSITPIEDFVDLIEAASAVGNAEAVQQALRTLADIALRTVVTGCSAPFYRRAVEYVSKLREVCVQEGEHAFYNAFVSTEIKQDFSNGRHRQFWDLVCAAGQQGGVGLITTAEDTGSAYSPADGQSFFGEEKVAPVVVQPVPLVADEDADLFDEMA